MIMQEKSLQERYAPHGTCFGCGPANPQGLRIRSFEAGEQVVASWRPQPHHAMAPGILNGGIVGTICDCHCNWTAAYALMRRDQRAETPPTVTVEYQIKLLAPTPMDTSLDLTADVVRLGNRSATTRCVVRAAGIETATCVATFVVVKPDHPAYRRWG